MFRVKWMPNSKSAPMNTLYISSYVSWSSKAIQGHLRSLTSDDLQWLFFCWGRFLGILRCFNLFWQRLTHYGRLTTSRKWDRRGQWHDRGWVHPRSMTFSFRMSMLLSSVLNWVVFAAVSKWERYVARSMSPSPQFEPIEENVRLAHPAILFDAGSQN